MGSSPSMSMTAFNPTFWPFLPRLRVWTPSMRKKNARSLRMRETRWLLYTVRLIASKVTAARYRRYAHWIIFAASRFCTAIARKAAFRRPSTPRYRFWIIRAALYAFRARAPAPRLCFSYIARCSYYVHGRGLVGGVGEEWLHTASAWW